MKILILLMLACAATGCATLSALPANPGTSTASAIDDTPALAAPDPIASPFPVQNTAPQIIIPATGGAPEIGIPLGGDLYLPVTGGPPVIGLSTSP